MKKTLSILVLLLSFFTFTHSAMADEASDLDRSPAAKEKSGKKKAKKKVKKEKKQKVAKKAKHKKKARHAQRSHKPRMEPLSHGNISDHGNQEIPQPQADDLPPPNVESEED